MISMKKLSFPTAVVTQEQKKASGASGCLENTALVSVNLEVIFISLIYSS